MTKEKALEAIKKQDEQIQLVQYRIEQLHADIDKSSDYDKIELSKTLDSKKAELSHAIQKKVDIAECYKAALVEAERKAVDKARGKIDTNWFNVFNEDLDLTVVTVDLQSVADFYVKPSLEVGDLSKVEDFDDIISIGHPADNQWQLSRGNADLNHDYAAMNGVYVSYFEQIKPARAAVQAVRLPKDAMVEIMVTAVKAPD